MPARVQRVNLNTPEEDQSRIFASHAELTATPCGSEAGCEHIDDFPIDNPVLDALLAIPGVMSAELHRYHALIHKAPTYDWNEIQPNVMSLLTSLNMTDLEELESRE